MANSTTKGWCFEVLLEAVRSPWAPSKAVDRHISAKKAPIATKVVALDSSPSQQSNGTNLDAPETSESRAWRGAVST